jgi:hypothetical protein
MPAEPLHLPQVTLCCVDTREVDLALAAIARCMAQVRFARVVFFTQRRLVTRVPEGVEVVDVDVPSVQAYSEFMLRGLAPHVHTTHALVAQWDGFVRDASCWDPGFLQCDYIGAPWAGRPASRAVGNGGFSLRSRKLLQALQQPGMQIVHPEDLAICDVNRERLESVHGIRIAPLEVAQRFAYERVLPSAPTFGFHGLFNFDREFEPAALQALLDALPDRLARGLEAHDLCASLIRQRRLQPAEALFGKRWRLGMRDRRTLRLAWRMLWLRFRQRSSASPAP